MELLEPGFVVGDAAAACRVGRLRVEADPVIDAAIDRALAASEWEVSEVELPRWHEATAAAGILLVAEAWETDRDLLARRPDEVGADVVGRLTLGASIDERGLASARTVKEEWDACLEEVFERVDVIATPTLTVFPPDARRRRGAAHGAVHAAGQPGRRPRPRPSGADLGRPARQPAAHRPRYGEGKLLAAGLVLESVPRTACEPRVGTTTIDGASDDAAGELGETGGPGQDLLDPVLAQELGAFCHRRVFDRRCRRLLEHQRTDRAVTTMTS